MNPTQFHQLSEDEQQRLADHYVENMRIIKAENIPFEDQGMRKFIYTHKSKTTLWPHTGKWIMKFKAGGGKSGRTVRGMIKELKSQI